MARVCIDIKGNPDCLQATHPWLRQHMVRGITRLLIIQRMSELSILFVDVDSQSRKQHQAW